MTRVVEWKVATGQGCRLPGTLGSSVILRGPWSILGLSSILDHLSAHIGIVRQWLVQLCVVYMCFIAHGWPLYLTKASLTVYSLLMRWGLHCPQMVQELHFWDTKCLHIC